MPKNHFVTDRTLQKYWRLAVLIKNNYSCVICGRIRVPAALECHHVIKRGHRVTRHDVENGVCVCVGECHREAHTERGKADIRAKLGDSLMDYLYERERVFVKDYKRALSFSTAELEEYELDKLKKVIGGYNE